MLALTFLLLALRNLFRLIVGAGTDETIFFLGIFMGIATLFYLQSISLLLAVVFSLLIFTGTKPRQYVLLLLGVVLPLALAFLYYGWQGNTQGLYWQYIRSFELLPSGNYLNLFSLSLLALVPLVFLLLGIYRYNNSHSFNNYQIRLQQSMFYFLLMGIVAFLFTPEKSAYHYFLLLPPLTFYISHYFLLIRNRLKAELYFLIFALLVLGLNYMLISGPLPYLAEWTNFTRLSVQERPEDPLVRGKQILSLSHDLSLYKEARLATPYLDWDLAEEQFLRLNYYDNLLEVYKNMRMEPPQVIVDDAGFMPQVFERMPILESKYRSDDRYPHVYLLIEE